MEESLAQEATAGKVKRSVSNRGSVQLDMALMNPLMKRITGRKARDSKPAPSAFMGDFGGRPRAM